MKLSKKHGFNPSIETCFLCGKDKGVVLFGQMKNDSEAPKKVCLNYEPCTECKGLMEKGIILISVDEHKSTDMKNPYRTGGWVVVKESVISEFFNESASKEVLNKRVCFFSDEVWDKLKLLR